VVRRGLLFGLGGVGRTSTGDEISFSQRDTETPGAGPD
jgi:hypothetical protein